MANKKIELNITIDNPYKIVTFLLLAILLFIGIYSRGVATVELSNSDDLIVQQACIEVEDCAAGWGCKRKHPHQMVGKCVDIDAD